MSLSMYPKMALVNLKNNHRFFIPRILTETGLLGSFFIFMTLLNDQRLRQVKGGAYLPTFMAIGTVVLAILSIILMFYTNSFVMKQRKREFGLYNILGMEKKHVRRVMFLESLFCSGISIFSGLLFGALFYKLASLFVCRLLQTGVIAGFYYLSPENLGNAAILFVLIDALTFLFNSIQIARMKPVEMMNSAHSGEKEPKVKWLVLIVGVISLVWGYWIAVTTVSPLKALIYFFQAILLVMLGTYCLFITGSIFVLKLLKKNKKYYYDPKHMTAVSGMLYRMKQNAVGLASISILATGVLIMISTTVSLYAGVEETLDQNYPQHYYVETDYYADGVRCSLPAELVTESIQTHARETGLTIAEINSERFLQFSANYLGNELSMDVSSATLDESLSSLSSFLAITEETYVRLGGEKLDLKPGEAAIAPIAYATDYAEQDFILDGRTYTVKKILPHFVIRSTIASVSRVFGMVVADDKELETIYQAQKNAYGDNASQYTERVSVTFADKAKAMELGETLSEAVEADVKNYLVSTSDSFSWGGADSIWEARESVYGMYGTLLFLGILLGLVFLFATVLIIYYKQISEGYEDRSRFQIMTKIGMSSEDVKKTIRSQILLVFFLPLIVAAIHVCFAFPLLLRLLRVLLLSSTWLFVGCTIVTFLVFAAIYCLIYSMTAKTYYKIVYLK